MCDMYVVYMVSARGMGGAYGVCSDVVVCMV